MTIYAVLAVVLFCLFIFTLCTGNAPALLATIIMFIVVVMCFIASESMAAEPKAGQHLQYNGKNKPLTWVYAEPIPAVAFIPTASPVVTCTSLPTQWRCMTRDGYVFNVHKTAAELRAKF